MSKRPFTDYVAMTARELRACARTEVYHALEGWLMQCGRNGTTVAVAADYLRQHTDGTGAYEWLPKRDQSAVVRGMLEQLRRCGVVETSIGLGERGGEARYYELLDTTPFDDMMRDRLKKARNV